MDLLADETRRGTYLGFEPWDIAGSNARYDQLPTAIFAREARKLMEAEGETMIPKREAYEIAVQRAKEAWEALCAPLLGLAP